MLLLIAQAKADKKTAKNANIASNLVVMLKKSCKPK